MFGLAPFKILFGTPPPVHDMLQNNDSWTAPSVPLMARLQALESVQKYVWEQLKDLYKPGTESLPPPSFSSRRLSFCAEASSRHSGIAVERTLHRLADNADGSEGRWHQQLDTCFPPQAGTYNNGIGGRMATGEDQ